MNMHIQLTHIYYHIQLTRRYYMMELTFKELSNKQTLKAELHGEESITFIGSFKIIITRVVFESVKMNMHIHFTYTINWMHGFLELWPMLIAL